jgi:hypothetical protein
MSETEQLLSLVGDIYDAVLEPALWMGVLEKAANFVGGSAASIFSLDTVNRAGNAYYLFGMDKEYEQLYFDKYIKYEPVGAGYLMLSAGEVTSNSVLIRPAEFHETRFYKEWAAPQRSVDNVIAILEKSQTSIGAFVVFRHEREGFADDNARSLLRLLTPHLRRAALISKVIELKATEGDICVRARWNQRRNLSGGWGSTHHPREHRRARSSRGGRHSALGPGAAGRARSASQQGFARRIWGRRARRHSDRRSGRSDAADRR